jgi:myo-inositol-hexaphosphate 3-phosphohydrolase
MTIIDWLVLKRRDGISDVDGIDVSKVGHGKGLALHTVVIQIAGK